MVSPDGGLWVSAGSSLVKYDRSGPTSFERVLDLPDRPHAPWSYPQTGEIEWRARGLCCAVVKASSDASGAPCCRCGRTMRLEG